MILTINGKQAALKKGSSIEYVSENRIFTDADDYSMEIELPLADCPQNIAIFGMMDEPFVTVNTVTGDKGIKQAQDEYQRLMNNKSPKNKRKISV